MKVSFVIPNYNRSEYISECVDSLQRQTFKDWEAVIVDDCSTDTSWDLLQWYANNDKRIRVFKNEKNMGIAYTRNYGVAMSLGEYIAVMDSDDLCSPDRLKIEVKEIEKHGVDFVYSSYVTTDSEGRAMKNGWVMPPDKLTIEGVIDGYTAPHVTILAKRKLFDKSPYMEQYRVNDDLPLVLGFLDKGYSYKRIKQPLVLVRYHPNSVSMTRDKEVKKITEEMRAKYGKK